MLTDKAKKQETLLRDYKSREEEFENVKQDFAEVKKSLTSMESSFKDERLEKESLKCTLSKQETAYNQLLNDHEKLSMALSLCAQTIKGSLQVYICLCCK